jgi:hypothetical protein
MKEAIPLFGFEIILILFLQAQNGPESPGGIIGICPVVVGKDMIIPTITKKCSTQLSNC